MFEINGKHILVTGGSSGFGRHFARFLTDKGASVTLAARRAEALGAGVAEINGSGVRREIAAPTPLHAADLQFQAFLPNSTVRMHFRTFKSQRWC